MSSTQRQAIGTDVIFDASKGLNVAIAFTAFDNEQENILDPSYGELVFREYKWGATDDGEYFISYDKIETHTCTRDELGLENP